MKMLVEFDTDKITSSDCAKIAKMGGKVKEFYKAKKYCCLCGEEILGYGNNPYPLADASLNCCNKCDKYVAVARVDMYYCHKSIKDVRKEFKNGTYRMFEKNV